jgi:hypothetical protein
VYAVYKCLRLIFCAEVGIFEGIKLLLFLWGSVALYIALPSSEGFNNQFLNIFSFSNLIKKNRFLFG